MPTPARPSAQRAARVEPVPTPRSQRIAPRATDSQRAARPSARPVETGKSSPRAAHPSSRAAGTEPRSKLGIGLGIAIVLTAGAVAFFIPFLARSPDEDALAAAVSAPSAPTASAATSPAAASAATTAIANAPASGSTAGAELAASTDPAAATDPEPIDSTPADSEAADSQPADSEAGDARRSRTRSSSRHVDPRRASGRETAELVRVRIVSTPPGRLHGAGGGALCETPCAITINPADGGSAESRSYVIKRPGYRDETITIDLGSPPTQLQVDLKKLRPAPAPAPRGDDKDADSTFNPFGEPEAGEAGNADKE
jgi:hypothetical protein